MCIQLDSTAAAGAALTPPEARQLAAALLRHAAAAEHPDGDAGTGQVAVSYLGRETYAAASRGHLVLTDQPGPDGEDAAMTPVELLVASLSSCVAFYAGRYLARHRLNRDGLQVTAEFVMATDGPARVRKVRQKLHVPGGLPPEREAALLAVASHCTVHNTLRQAPDIAIELASPLAAEPASTKATTPRMPGGPAKR
jgi:putative redox protein